VPTYKQARIRESLNKIWELEHYSDVDVVTGTPFNSSQFGEWRKGIHRPNKAAIAILARKYNTSEADFVAGRVREESGEYSKPLDKERATLLEELRTLVEDPDTDQDVIDRLKSELSFLRRLPRPEKKGA